MSIKAASRQRDPSRNSACRIARGPTASIGKSYTRLLADSGIGWHAQWRRGQTRDIDANSSELALRAATAATALSAAASMLRFPRGAAAPCAASRLSTIASARGDVAGLGFLHRCSGHAPTRPLGDTGWPKSMTMEREKQRQSAAAPGRPQRRVPLCGLSLTGQRRLPAEPPGRCRP